MAKRKKYTLEIFIFDELAKERIRKDELSEYIEDRGQFVSIKKTGMSSISLLKNLYFFVSALHTICCKPDENGNPDNWKFAFAINEAIINLSHNLNFEITGKAFDKWLKDFIICNEERNATHVRALLTDNKDYKVVSIMAGYDWEDDKQ